MFMTRHAHLLTSSRSALSTCSSPAATRSAHHRLYAAPAACSPAVGGLPCRNGARASSSLVNDASAWRTTLACRGYRRWACTCLWGHGGQDTGCNRAAPARASQTSRAAHGRRWSCVLPGFTLGCDKIRSLLRHNLGGTYLCPQSL